MIALVTSPLFPIALVATMTAGLVALGITDMRTITPQERKPHD